jgi:N,N-dimethylformamidase beta subunit-like protein
VVVLAAVLALLAPVPASFTGRSYAPGATATLRGSGPVQLYRAGAGREGPMQGRAVGPVQTAPIVRIGNWPSGLYYAKVGGWYAPFVLRPRRLGEHRVLVVLPTNTWQAYNFEGGDSWYEDASVHTIDLSRPYADGGVPPHYRGYDRGFERWLALHRLGADFVSDDDLERSSGEELARAYDLIVFPGHEEYVTAHEYGVIERYRDLGGNLAFLSANDFFYEVVRHGDRMDGRRRWRDLGRPEAALVGAQYVDWNHGQYPNRPFTVVAAPSWLFRGTGLRPGDSFGVYGIEVDARCPASPSGTLVLARIPSIFGPGKSAEMTYYTTPAGAKVFSAGVMNFGGSALWPVVRTMLANLWVELSRP